MLHEPDKWSRDDRRAWNSVQNRFPGIGKEVERAALKMAVYVDGIGRTRIDYNRVDGGFTAHLEVFSFLCGALCGPEVYPVIPDEANAHPDKLITKDMDAFVFVDLKECQKVAEEAERIFLKGLRSTEHQIAHEKRQNLMLSKQKGGCRNE
jgi:hypothetical protein